MIDRVEIYTRGGKGGDGAATFRREKYVPFGGPNGGDGGDGGSIILVATRSKTTLADLRRQKHYRAQNGENGRSKQQYGKKGESLLLGVPIGTIVRIIGEGGEQIDLGDLTADGQELIVAKGGKGGFGNMHFATPAKQAPMVANAGEPGQERNLTLDLKLLADVGLVGFPNVGKSTLINAVSAARSKVAAYPFTTLEPKLGVVELGYKAFVIADIPGIIEGAHSGRGLGHEFLRHIERTRILVHIIDGCTTDPNQGIDEINNELFLFNPDLRDKPQILAINKIDIPSVRERMDTITAQLAGYNAPIFFISAATGEGVTELMNKVVEILSKSAKPPPPTRSDGYKTFRPRPVK